MNERVSVCAPLQLDPVAPLIERLKTWGTVASEVVGSAAANPLTATKRAARVVIPHMSTV